MSVKQFNTRIALKLDTAAAWIESSVASKGANLVLLKGEFAWNEGIKNFKIGDGTSAFSALNYAIPTVKENGGLTATVDATSKLNELSVSVDGTTIKINNNGQLYADGAGSVTNPLTIGSGDNKVVFNGSVAYTVDFGSDLTKSLSGTTLTITPNYASLAVSDITANLGVGKTITALSQTDGKISATASDIAITHNQVTDWSTNVGVTAVSEGSTNGTISVTTNGTASSVAVHGLGSAAYTDSTAYEAAFTDGSASVTAGVVDYTAGTGETATKKIEFKSVKQAGGAIADDATVGTLYFSKAITASDPLIVKSDLSGVIGALVYKGTATAPVSGSTEWTPSAGTASDLATGWMYIVAADATVTTGTTLLGKSIPAGTYHTGDYFVYNGTDWNAFEGSVPVVDGNQTLTAGADSVVVATVNGVDIHVKAAVTNGSATIATVSNDVVTLKAGVEQTSNTGTITNTSSSDIVLAKAAKTGLIEDLGQSSTEPNNQTIIFYCGTSTECVNIAN